MNPQDRVRILNKLKERPFIKQRSEEWFKLRETRLTASDLHDAIYHPSSLIKKKIKTKIIGIRRRITQTGCWTTNCH